MMKNSDSASKYKDIISNSSKIQAGSPDVYQLKPKKEMIGTLTRKTVGDRNPDKINKTILLVGETGTGKSTLINTLVNYTMGVKFEDDIWFEIVENDDKKSPLESQTSDVIVYEIFGFEDETLPYSLTIIDTPGYGNTRGIEQDVIVSERLIDLFRSEDGVHEINAVGLVMKASDTRLSDRMRYIFDSVVSLFGKDLEKNIVALITYSDGRRPKSAIQALEKANIKCAKNEKNQPVHFLFDNCNNEDQTEDTEYLDYAHKITKKGMRQFTAFLKEAAPQKLHTTMNVLNERTRLTACIQNLKERIELVDLKQTEMQQTEEALNKLEKEMKKNVKVTIEVDEAYKTKETISGGLWGLLFYEGAVRCKVCKENCHYPGCTVAWYPNHCEVIEDGNCTVCTKRCPVSVHVKDKTIYVNKTKKVKKTIEKLEETNESKKVAGEKMTLLGNLKEEMKKLEKDKTEWLNVSYQHVVQLDQIALRVDSASTYVHLDFLIEKMREKGDTEKVQKLEEMKHRSQNDNNKK